MHLSIWFSVKMDFLCMLFQNSQEIINLPSFQLHQRVQVRFLMLNTMCLTSLHNIQQDLINLYHFFSSLLMQMIFFLLLKQTVLNSDTRYFRASMIYIYTNPMVMYELMRIRHTCSLVCPAFDHLITTFAHARYGYSLYFLSKQKILTKHL